MKRMSLFGLALLVLITCSGCVGLQKVDLVNAKMVSVTNAQEEQGRAFSFSSIKFSKGIWHGLIIDEFASGLGSMVMYDVKGKQSGVFDGTLQEGKAIDMGTLQFGTFTDNGKLTRPIVVFTGLWQNGMPNGNGKLEVYGQDGRLAYFITGSFKDGTVNGPYFQFNPKQGTWTSGFNDSEHQKIFVIE